MIKFGNTSTGSRKAKDIPAGEKHRFSEYVNILSRTHIQVKWNQNPGFIIPLDIAFLCITLCTILKIIKTSYYNPWAYIYIFFEIQMILGTEGWKPFQGNWGYERFTNTSTGLVKSLNLSFYRFQNPGLVQCFFVFFLTSIFLTVKTVKFLAK